MGSVSPTCDERVNAARKIATEFIDVSWHVVIVQVLLIYVLLGNVLFGRKAGAHALKGVKGLRQRRQRARAALGRFRGVVLAAPLRLRGFFGGDLIDGQRFDPVDGGGQMRSVAAISAVVPAKAGTQRFGTC